MMIPTGFYGDITHYVDLPKADEIYDWERYTTPNWLLEDSNNENNLSIDDTEDLDDTESIDDSNNSNNIYIL